VYYPIRYPEGQWQVQSVLGAEDVQFVTEDGVRLHGWFVRKPDARWVTLHLHGNGGNLTHRSFSARHITDAGSSVLLLDYRGYGKSEGRPGEQGLYKDATAGYNYLLGLGYRPEQIIAHGESLGTAVAADLVIRHPCAGLILEAPFTSAAAVAGRVLPVIGPLLIGGFNTRSKMRLVRVPVFIIHGDRDEVIAYEFGQELYAAAPEPKQFWTLEGATHNNLHIAGAKEFSRRLSGFYDMLGQSVEHNTQRRPPNDVRGDH
jgi:uncharacterized protein